MVWSELLKASKIKGRVVERNLTELEKLWCGPPLSLVEEEEEEELN
jgi:hypothetical protein